MTARPIDSAGDILPVLSPASLLSGAPAVASALRDHLRVFTGDWWEYPDRGNPVFDLIAAGPMGEKDLPALAACVTSYVMEFPAVRAVSDVRASLADGVMMYSAVAHLDSGDTAPIQLIIP